MLEVTRIRFVAAHLEDEIYRSEGFLCGRYEGRPFFVHVEDYHSPSTDEESCTLTWEDISNTIEQSGAYAIMDNPLRVDSETVDNLTLDRFIGIFLEYTYASDYPEVEKMLNHTAVLAPDFK